MTTAADAALPSQDERRTATVTPIRALPALADPAAAARRALVRRMAADRLRDLRDDGVTAGYIARMYGVEKVLMEDVMQDLGLPTR